MGSTSAEGAGPATFERGSEPVEHDKIEDGGWNGRATQERLIQTEAARRFIDLERLIQGEIIPRLMLAHGTSGSNDPQGNGQGFDGEFDRLPAGAVETFSSIIVDRDVAAAFAFIERLRASGVTLEMIYLELLAPAALRLGELWNQDINYFSDVAVGLSRLHHIVRDLSPDFVGEESETGRGHSALIVPMPGEDHSFGLVLVVEFFRRAGWDVWGWPLSMGTDVLTTVRNVKFDLVGISASLDSSVDELTSTIASIRNLSRNGAVKVMVGGPLFLRRPELVAQVGADATAEDGRQSVRTAKALVAERISGS